MSVDNSLPKVKGNQTGYDNCPKGCRVEDVTDEVVAAIFGEDDGADAAETEADDDDDAETEADVFARIPTDPALRRPEDIALLEMRELPETSDIICRAFDIAVAYDLDGDNLWGAFLTFYHERVKSTETFNAENYLQFLRTTHAAGDIRAAESRVERGSRLAIRNYRIANVWPEGEHGKVKTITVPLQMAEVLDQIRLACDNWPRRIGNTLFVDDAQHGICMFDRHAVAGVFGWQKSRRKVDWKTTANYVSQAEVVAELQRTSVQYDGIATLPHEPTVESLYYTAAAEAIVPGNGQYLAALLDRFRPATPEDRLLLQAALMTIVWGGPAGKRPAFLITAPAGRGVGKSTTADMMARLFAGSLDFGAGDDIATIKSRMLLPAVAGLRIAKLDNVKTNRFSWGEWEGLLTANRISGKQMYVGDAQRPNLWTWLLTLNGASLSTDVAQRCVIIYLAAGENQDDWYEVTTQMIDQHRDEIIGDLVAALRASQTPLERYTRWTSWEREVLCRLPAADQLQKLILERQGEANVEDEEAGLVEEYFTAQVRAMCGVAAALADRHHWFVPSQTAATWLGEALGRKLDTAVAGKWLAQKIGEGKLPSLVANKSRRPGRGFVWRGRKAPAEAEPRELTDVSDKPIAGRFFGSQKRSGRRAGSRNEERA